jgi:hypothetical protein
MLLTRGVRPLALRAKVINGMTLQVLRPPVCHEPGTRLPVVAGVSAVAHLRGGEDYISAARSSIVMMAAGLADGSAGGGGWGLFLYYLFIQ